MTSMPNKVIDEHLLKMNYCVSISGPRSVQISYRASYANYPFVDNQKQLGAILNFLLLFRHLENIESDSCGGESNCCCAGFEHGIMPNMKTRYMISNLRNVDRITTYDFEYHLISYESIYRMTVGEVSGGTYIFIPESYVWYLSAEYPNRVGMIVKLQARTYISKPLPRVIDSGVLPNHMLVLACVALQSGYPVTFETMDGDNVEIADLAYMPILCSVDEWLIRDIMYSHGFTLEFSLPIEFEVRDVERVRSVGYDHVLLGNAYFASSGGLVANHIIQPYANIRFLR